MAEVSDMSNREPSMGESRAAQRIQGRLDALARKPRHPGVALSVRRPADGFAFDGGAGALDADAPFFIASTTKLHTAALVFRLEDAGALRLDDPLAKHLPAADLEGLHVRRGVDRTAEITVRHLLGHTSGLPDYFQLRRGGRSLLQRVQAGEDAGWTYDDVLRWARELGPRFDPGAGRKAHYADTNHQLLGRIVERHHGAPLGEVMREAIFEPLGLRRTWMYCDPADDRPAPLRFQRRALAVPKAMASFQADGGVVSTARELVVFVQAFFEGRLFDPARLPSLVAEWRRIFFPLEYGVGVMRLALPRLLTLGRRLPTLHGHSGLSGAFAFCAPERGVYLAGTVNQVASPGTSFELMLKVLGELDRG